MPVCMTWYLTIIFHFFPFFPLKIISIVVDFILYYPVLWICCAYQLVEIDLEPRILSSAANKHFYQSEPSGNIEAM